MLVKIKSGISYLAHNITDLRVLGQVLFAIIVLLVSWSCVRAIQTNYELQQRIAVLEKERDITRLENQNLGLSNQFLNTAEFLELAARRQLGKAAPGEKLVMVPKRVALARATVSTEVKSESQKAAEKPFYQRNAEAWLNFFFHRSN